MTGSNRTRTPNWSTPWSEPTYTGNPDSFKAALSRKARAEAKAKTVPPWTCPRCGVTWPGTNRNGRPRRGCPDPRCAGQARAAKARETGAHRNFRYGPGEVATILGLHKTGKYGYRRLASMLDIPASTVRNIVRRHEEVSR